MTRWPRRARTLSCETGRAIALPRSRDGSPSPRRPPRETSASDPARALAGAVGRAPRRARLDGGGDAAAAGSTAARSHEPRAVRRSAGREASDRGPRPAVAPTHASAPGGASVAEGARVRALALRQGRVRGRRAGSRAGGAQGHGARADHGGPVLARRDLLPAQSLPASGPALPSG